MDMQESPSSSVPNQQTDYPRLLLIDHTRIGDGSATGEIKANLFHEWPPDRIMQLHAVGDELFSVMAAEPNTLIYSNMEIASNFEFWKMAATFNPDVILYRPTPNPEPFHTFVMQFLKSTDIPLALWIMDDWPTALATSAPDVFQQLAPDWRDLLKRSACRLSISEPMSKAFEARYNTEFLAIANGVDSSHWPPAKSDPTSNFCVRYAGSLAENMTLDTLRLIAKAIENLALSGRKVRFEIKTRPLWRDAARLYFENFNHTSFHTDDLTPSKYRSWLSGGDAVIIAYNFDKQSKSYVQYSMANKLPECLACGAPLLAVGPKDIATLSYLDAVDCGIRINKPDEIEIAAAIKALMDSPAQRFLLADKAQSVAFKKLNIRKGRALLRNALSSILTDRQASISFSREAHAEIDETAIIAKLVEEHKGKKHVMLDIGAHHGTSAAYFSRLGWTVHCFEPDPANRAILSRIARKETNITIDPRAVSDAPAKNVAFFQSSISSGISSLRPFHETHKEVERVNVTTVGDIIGEYNLSRVDFLKIDAEGFDFSILKGVPWSVLSPDIIECEFEDAKTLPLGHAWKCIADYLNEQGYVVYVSEWHPISQYGAAHDWRRILSYPAPDVPDDAWGNLLAFRTDPGAAILQRAFFEMAHIDGLERTLPSQSAYKRLAKGIYQFSPRLYDILHRVKTTLDTMLRLEP